MIKYIPYLKINLEVTETPYGFNKINNFDNAFRGFKARDKVLCKSDLLASLIDVFEETTIKNYRGIISAIILGDVKDACTLSKMLIALYTDDSKFKEYINALFYLEKEETPFGTQIIRSLVQKVRDVESKWKMHFKKYGYKVFMSANGYLYYAVDDINRPISIPEQCDCEVLTYAKNWKGNFCRQGRD